MAASGQSSSKLTAAGLQVQADRILQEAKKRGIESNFFFATTFKRYQVQMSILDALEKEIESNGAIVTKEYVKGRGNIYTHPAIGEYNKTATAANGTVATLINIVKNISTDNTSTSKLQDLIDGLGDE